MIRIILLLFAFSTVQAQTVIVWERVDGGLTIQTPNWSEKPSKLSTLDFIESVKGALATDPQYLVPHVMSITDIPKDDADGSFQEAWEWTGATVVVNRSKAEKLHRQRLQSKVREAMMRGDLSIEGAIAAQKSAAATDLTTAATLNDLKAMVPEVLKPKAEKK